MTHSEPAPGNIITLRTCPRRHRNTGNLPQETQWHTHESHSKLRGKQSRLCWQGGRGPGQDPALPLQTLQL